LAEFDAGFSEEKMASLFQPFPSDTKPSSTTEYDYDSDSDLDDDEVCEIGESEELFPAADSEKKIANASLTTKHILYQHG
jgi:hypothetical protein